jgi:predicted Fe-Mo cluster-binding NifX family protein
VCFLKVAVASSDGEYVHVGHFGEATFYLIYECKGGEAIQVARVKNTYADMGHDLGSDESHKRKGIHELLSGVGVSVFIATAMGPGGKRFFENRAINVVLVKPGTSVSEALRLVCV